MDQPVKNKQEAYEKLVEISRIDDYTAGNLLDYLWHKVQSNYKLIGIDLSRQTIPKQINLGEKLEEGNGATKFLLLKSSNKEILNIFLKMTRKWNNVNEQSSRNYAVWNDIISNIEVLKSKLCDSSNAYIPVGGDIAVAGNIAAWVPFKKFALPQG